MVTGCFRISWHYYSSSFGRQRIAYVWNSWWPNSNGLANPMYGGGIDDDYYPFVAEGMLSLFFGLQPWKNKTRPAQNNSSAFNF